MNDPTYFDTKLRLFRCKGPKQKCLDYLSTKTVPTPIFTINTMIYGTGGLTDILRLISTTAHKYRHFYEIVPPGMPCKLFFDIDCAIKAGGVSLRDRRAEYQSFERRLLAAVRRKLRIEYNYEDTADEAAPYVLTADTPTKLSRHLIFPVVFASITDVGDFVRTLDLGQTSWADFVDRGVYTKWRNFRMVGSSKKDQSNHLRLCSHVGLTLTQQVLRTMLTIIRFDDAAIPDKYKPHILWTPRIVVRVGAPAPTHPSPRSYLQSQATTTVPDTYPANTTAIVEYVERTILSLQYAKHGYTRTFNPYNGSLFVDYVLTPGVACPNNNGRAHRNNKTYFKIDLTRGLAFFRCADPECSKSSFGIVRDLDLKVQGHEAPIRQNVRCQTKRQKVDEY